MLWAMRLTSVSRSGLAACTMSESISSGGRVAALRVWVTVRLMRGGGAGSSRGGATGYTKARVFSLRAGKRELRYQDVQWDQRARRFCPDDSKILRGPGTGGGGFKCWRGGQP